MKKLLKNIVYVLCIMSLEIATLALLFLVPLNQTLENNSLQDMMMRIAFEDLIHQLDSNYHSIDDFEMDEEVLVKIMESEEFKTLMAGLTNKIGDYILTGKEQSFITKEELKTVTSQAIDIVNKQSDREITMEEEKQILQIIDENGDHFLEQLEMINMLDENMSQQELEGLNLLRFLLSMRLKLYLVFVIILSLIGIILLKWKEAKWIQTVTISLLVASILSLGANLLLKVISSSLFTGDISYIQEPIHMLTQKGLVLSSGLLILMIAILIFYKLLIYRKKGLTSEG